MLPPSSCFLPADLLHDIIQQYVGVSLPLLSRMDVACCNHSMRPDWLTVLARMTLPNNCSKAVRPACCYISWIASRRVHGAPLVMNVDEMAMQLSQQIVAGIDTICLKGKTSCASSSIAIFIARFPNLTAIDCRSCLSISNMQLAAIQEGLQNPLKILKLDVEGLSANSIADFVSVTALSSLKELCLTNIVDETLLSSLASLCHLLKIIDISLAYHRRESESTSTTTQLVYQLCLGSRNYLEQLTVLYRASTKVR